MENEIGNGKWEMGNGMGKKLIKDSGKPVIM